MVGEKLGSFRIEGTLGVGAMGVVYKATNESTGKPAAVKVILNEIAQKGKPYERFRREAEILQQFRHSNIVRFLALGRYKGTSYFAMEYVEGETLEDMLKRDGPMEWREVVDIGIQLCDALHYAHEHGVVHRDLKPSNLMISKEGQVKLTDFGIAKDLDATALTATGRTLGTAAYMAPEQIRGTPEVSHKTDLYALGIVFYQMLTGAAPFEGTSAVQLMHNHLNSPIPRPSNKLAEIPKALDNLIVQLMAKEPAQRPWDAAAVAVSLTAIRDKAERGETVPMVWSQDEPGAGSKSKPSSDPVKKKPKKAAKANLSDRSGAGSARQIAEVCGLLLALAFVGGIIAYILIPESETSLYKHAEQLMTSADRHDWERARDDYLNPLDKRFPNNPYKTKTREWRDKLLLTEAEARSKALQSPVRIPLNAPATKTENRFVEYWLEISLNLTKHDELKAMAYYEDFAKPLDPNDPGDRGWILLAKERILELRQSILSRRELVIGRIERARKAEQNGNADEAKSILDDLRARYGDYTDLVDLIGVAPAPTQNPPATLAPPGTDGSKSS